MFRKTEQQTIPEKPPSKTGTLSAFLKQSFKNFLIRTYESPRRERSSRASVPLKKHFKRVLKLPRLDSNQKRMIQSHLCYQLHHRAILFFFTFPVLPATYVYEAPYRAIYPSG